MTVCFTVVGKRASGKDTFCGYLTEKYGIPSVRFSTVIAETGLELGLITPDQMQDKAALQNLGARLRRQYGSSRIYTERVARKVYGEIHTINGMRQPDELGYLKEILGDDVFVVGIKSDDERRYERALQSGIVSSREEFQALEAHPAELHIETLLKDSKYQITNNDTPLEFQSAIDHFLGPWIRMELITHQ